MFFISDMARVSKFQIMPNLYLDYLFFIDCSLWIKIILLFFSWEIFKVAEIFLLKVTVPFRIYPSFFFRLLSVSRFTDLNFWLWIYKFKSFENSNWFLSKLNVWFVIGGEMNSVYSGFVSEFSMKKSFKLENILFSLFVTLLTKYPQRCNW